MTDLEIAIERVDAAATELRRALEDLRRVADRGLTPRDDRAFTAALNRARRSAA